MRQTPQDQLSVLLVRVDLLTHERANPRFASHRKVDLESSSLGMYSTLVGVSAVAEGIAVSSEKMRVATVRIVEYEAVTVAKVW